MEEKVLKQYVATANNPAYKGDWNIIDSKFPELKDVDKTVLKQYVATANNPKYNGDYTVINSKFPEFFQPSGVLAPEQPNFAIVPELKPAMQQKPVTAPKQNSYVEPFVIPAMYGNETKVNPSNGIFTPQIEAGLRGEKNPNAPLPEKRIKDWFADLGEGMAGTTSTLVGNTLDLLDRFSAENLYREIALRYGAGSEGYKAAEQMRKENSVTGDNKYFADKLISLGKEMSDKSTDYYGTVEENGQTRPKDFTDLWSEGRYGAAVGNILLEGGKSLPTSIAAFNPAGLAVIGAGTFNEKYNDVSTNTNMGVGASLLNATGTAAFELLSERLGQGIEKGIFKKLSKETADKTIKSIVLEFVKAQPKEMLTEGVEEAANTLAAGLLDYATGASQKPGDLKEIFKSFMYGAGGGAMGGVTIGTTLTAVNSKMVNDVRKQYKSADTNLGNILITGGFNPQEVEEIKQTILSTDSKNRNNVIVAISQAIPNAITKEDGKIKFNSEISKAFTDFYKSSDNLQQISAKFEQEVNAEKQRQDLESQQIQAEKENAFQQIDEATNVTTGEVQEIELVTGEKGIVNGGAIKYKEDGKIDVEATGIVSFREITGVDDNGKPIYSEPKVFNPKLINVLGQAKPADQAKEEAGILIDQTIAEAEIDNFYPTDVEEYTFNDKTWEINVDPQTGSLTKQEIERGIGEDGQPAVFVVDEPIAINDAEYAEISGKKLPESIKTIANEPLNDDTQGVGTNNVVENTPVTPETAQVELPKDKEGNIDYSLIEDAETYATGLTQEFGNDAPSVIDELLSEQNSLLKKAEKKSNVIERKRATAKIQKEIDKLSAVMDIIAPKEVAPVVSEVAPEISTPNVEIVNSTAPIKGQETVTFEVQSANPAKQPKAKGAYIQPKIAKSLKEAGEPQTLRELIMMKLMSGTKLKWDDIKNETGAILSRGLGAEYRYSKTEKKPRANNWYGYLEKTDEGITLEQLAHSIWEANAYEQGQFEDMPLFGLDTQDILDEILDVANTYSTTGKMADGLNESRLQLSQDEQAHIENVINAPDEIVDNFDDYMLASFLGLSNFTPEQISELNTFIDGWEENITNYAEDNIDPTAEGGSAEDSQAIEGDNGNQERQESGNSDSGVYGAAESEEVNPYASSNADAIEEAQKPPMTDSEVRSEYLRADLTREIDNANVPPVAENELRSRFNLEDNNRTQLTNSQKQLVDEAELSIRKKLGKAYPELQVKNQPKKVNQSVQPLEKVSSEQAEIKPEVKNEIPVSEDGLYQIYEYKTKDRTFFGVPTAENKGLKGRSDDLFDTIEEAIQGVKENRIEEVRLEKIRLERIEEKKQEELDKIAELERKEANKGKSKIELMNEGKFDKILDTKVNYDGVVMTRRQFITKSVKEGGALKIYQVNKIKDLSRVAYNRLDGRAQDAFDQRQKEAGKVNEYNIVHKDGTMNTISKTEYDFAESLLKQPAPEPNKSKETVKEENNSDEPIEVPLNTKGDDIVYRGIDKRNLLGEGTGIAGLGKGFYSTNSLKIAENYAWESDGKRGTVKAFKNGKPNNPLILKRTELGQWIKDNIQKSPYKSENEFRDNLSEYLLGLGYDGMTTVFEDGTEAYVKYFPKQPTSQPENSNADKMLSASSRFKPSEVISFDNPIVGPNGNKLISYRWAYEWTMQPNFEGELKGKRVSDWTQAEQSAETGKDLVHQFTVEKTDGTVVTVSSETIPQLLGYVDKTQTTTLSNLVTATKTLAKQKMQLSIMEAQKAEYDAAVEMYGKQEKPGVELATGDKVGFIDRLRSEKGEQTSHTRFYMGDVFYDQSKRMDRNGNYIEDNTPNRETIEQLEIMWVKKQAENDGLKNPNGLTDLRNRVARQEAKVKAIEIKNEQPTKQSTSPETELVTVITELASAKAKYDKAQAKYLDLKKKLEKDPAFGMNGQKDIFDNVSGADNLFGNDGQKQAVEAVQAAKKQANDLKPAVDELQTKADKLREAVTNKILKQQEVKFEEEKSTEGFRKNFDNEFGSFTSVFAYVNPNNPKEFMVQTTVRKANADGTISMQKHEKWMPIEKYDDFVADLNKRAETKEQQQGEFKYRLTRRPPSIGTHPTENLISDPIQTVNEKGMKEWVLTYSKKLDPKEVASFELTPVVDGSQYVGKKVQGIFGKYIYTVKEVTPDFVSMETTASDGRITTKDMSITQFVNGIDNGSYKLVDEQEPQGKQQLSVEEQIKATAAKYGWAVKRSAKGFELVNRKGITAATLTIDAAKGKYTFNYPDGEKILSGNKNVSEAIDKVIKGNFYGEELPAFQIISKNNKLVALHNISEDKLLNAEKIGGLPMPSIAITNIDNAFDSFGEITLIGNKRLIDPKNKENKIFAGDAYSPRYPNVTYNVKNSKAVEKFANKLPEQFARSAWHRIDQQIEDRGLKGLKDSGFVMYQFLKERGIDTTVERTSRYPKHIIEAISNIKGYDFLDIRNNEEAKKIVSDLYMEQNPIFSDMSKRSDFLKLKMIDENGTIDSNILRDFFNSVKQESRIKDTIDESKTLSEARKYIEENGLKSEFNNYAENLYDSFNVEERIFKGYTPSGSKRYVPHTLDNVMKEMKSKKVAGGEGMFYGAGSARALVSPQFKSIEQIKAKQDLIVSSKDFDAVKEDINNELYTVSELVKPFYKYSDHVTESMSEELTTLARNGQSESFNKLSPEAQQAVGEFLEKLRNLPTEYFEAKITRPVYLSEFTAAIVPMDASPKTIEMLENAGLKVERYDNNRAEVLKRLAEENNAAFQIKPEAFDAARTASEKYEAAVEITKGLDEQNNTETIVARDNEEFISMLPEEYADFLRTEDVGGVFYKGNVIVNSEKQSTGTDILLVYEHEYAHKSSRRIHSTKELADLWENATESDKLLLPEEYLDNPDWVKGDELISHAVEDIIEKQGYDNYKNGNNDLSSYSEILQDKLKKTIDHANQEYLRNIQSRNTGGSSLSNNNAGETIGNLRETGNGRQTPEFGRENERTSGQSERDVQGAVPGRSEGILQGKILVDGVERPTTNSTGKPIHSTEEGIRNFWRWFGDSKVVDESGRPLVVYHGTPYSFNEFEDNGSIELGYKPSFWFTTDIELAKYHSRGGKVINSYLSIQNPKIGGNTSDIKLDDKYDGFISLKGKWDSKTQEYDYTNGVIEIVYATDPTQIKSATGNDGSFDPNEPDIRYQIIGERGAEALDAAEEATTRLDNLRVAKEMEGKTNPLDTLLNEYLEKGSSLDNENLMENYGLKRFALQKKYGFAVLSLVETKTKGQGLGTKFMTDLINWADKNNVSIALTPSTSFGATSVNRLKDFYKQFGFNENKGRSKDFSTTEAMIRTPKEVKQFTTQEIRLATGWEKGVDGLWRYEVPDIEIKKDVLKELEKNQYLSNQDVNIGLVNYRKEPSGLYTLEMHKKGATSTKENVEYKNLSESELIGIIDNKEVSDKILAGEGGESFIGDNWDESKEIKTDFTTFITGGLPLSEVINDNELFKAYPQLKDIIVVVNKRQGHGAAYITKDDGQKVIEIGFVWNRTHSGIIHEIQHAIQDIEGFAKGGKVNNDTNTNAFESYNYNSREAKAIIQAKKEFKNTELGKKIESLKYTDTEQWLKLMNERNTLNEEWKAIVKAEDNFKKETGLYPEYYLKKYPSFDKFAFENYRQLSGETEARNASARMNFTADERRQRLLSETSDVAPEDQIILMDGMGVSESRLTRTNTPPAKPNFPAGTDFLKVIEGNKKYNEKLQKWQKKNLEKLAAGQPVDIEKLNKTVNSVKGKLWEGLADSQKPVKKWQDYLTSQGVNISDNDNYYMRFTMTESRIEQAYKSYEVNMVNPFIDTLKKLDKLGLKYENIADYTKLKHADEYTEHIASQKKQNITPDLDYAGKKVIEDRIGMSAENYISEVENIAGTIVDTLWQQIRKLSTFSLEEEVRSGLRTRESADTIIKTFDYYVPLKGHADPTAEIAWNYNTERGDFFVSAVKRGKGRSSESADPFSYIVSAARSSIGSAEQNILLQTILRTAELDTTGSTSVTKTWFVKTGEETDEFGNAKAIFEVEPEVVYEENDTQESYNAKVATHEAKMKDLAEKGEAYRGRIPKLDIGVWIKPTNVHEHEVHVRRNGEMYTVRFNTAPRVPQAINKTNFRHYEGFIGKTFEYIGGATRFLAATKTMFRPTFIFITNPLRDIHAGLNLAFIDEGPAFAANVAKYIPLASYTLTKRALGKAELSNKYDKMLNDYLINGGKTGISKILELKQVEVDLKDKISKKPHPLRGAKEVYQAISEITENQVRLAVFMAAKEKGYSTLKSTSMAKEATVNFDRKGNGKNGLRELKSLHAFVNVGFQALDNIYTKSTKNSETKKRALISITLNVAAGMLAVAAISSAICKLFGEEYDKWIEDISKLSEFERNNNFVIWTPWGVLKYPLAQEFRVYHALGMDAMMYYNGKQTGVETAVNLIKGFSSLVPYNPIESTLNMNLKNIYDIPTAFLGNTVDLLSPLTQLAVNRNFMGGSIYKENQDEDKPGHMQVKTDKFGKPFAPESMVDFSRFLNKITGGDDVVEGVSFNPDVMNQVLNGYLVGLYQQPLTLLESGYKKDISEFIPSAVWKSEDDIKNRNQGLNEDYYEIKDEVEETKRRIDGYIKSNEQAKKDFKAEMIDKQSYAEIIAVNNKKIAELQTEDYYKNFGIVNQINSSEDELKQSTKEMQDKLSPEIYELKESVVYGKGDNVLTKIAEYKSKVQKLEDYKKSIIFGAEKDPELEQLSNRLYDGIGRISSTKTDIEELFKKIKSEKENGKPDSVRIQKYEQQLIKLIDKLP